MNSGTDLEQNHNLHSEDDILHDLMAFKVREILLVTTAYDAFILDQEGQVSERIFDEYFNLNLSNAPRITSVSYASEALKLLETHPFDMVVLMLRIDGGTAFELARKIRSSKKDLPVLVLLKDNSEIALLKQELLVACDTIFVWNGDSKIFLAMIKFVEDKINAASDTRIGLVRVILLVEDSIRYYSRYLPVLYAEIIRQTQRLIAEEQLVEKKKLLRMRARPKVLMATNYEKAVELFEAYRDYIICVISDVRYDRNGVQDEQAGIELIRYVKSRSPDLPVVLQSSEVENAASAAQLKATFIDKNSQHLSSDLQSFILGYLGFGDFVFRDSTGLPIVRAHSVREVERCLAEVPDSSIEFHAKLNHFSAWLMARGEIQVARQIQPIKVSDFESPVELRRYLLKVFHEVRIEKTRGKVINFDPTAIGPEGHILRLATGSLGGKGRGIAFVNSLIHTFSVPASETPVRISIPQTSVIGTDAFDVFIERNQLKKIWEKKDIDFQDIQSQCLHSDLPPDLVSRLRILLEKTRKPLAVRSSSLFEDSISHPFSGVYPTYFIPNNSERFDIRFKDLCDAIKLIYASVFSPSARAYFEAIHYSIEEEKMAILIQPVIGHPYGDRFYPHISGIAQSYNYYPFSYIKPEDGLAVAAVGLGRYVEEAQQAFRFCPKYPRLDILSTEDQIRYSQTHLYAIDMRDRKYDLRQGDQVTVTQVDLETAEADGTLAYTASVYDPENQVIQVGLYIDGPRIINFAYLLKYQYFPVAGILEMMLDHMKKAMGTPVELEFCVDLAPDDNGLPVFYILQVKHLIREAIESDLNLSEVKNENVFIFTEKGMGNGRIDDIHNIIYADPDKFDPMKTEQMALEVERLNERMRINKEKYLLIGPGRWGTRDHSLGIPVAWTQISGASVIVEVGLEDFRIDASLGSHFFHNITSMNIGYFTVPFQSPRSKIDWAWLKEQPTVQWTAHFLHVRLKSPLCILMDGRKSMAVIYKNHPQ